MELIAAIQANTAITIGLIFGLAALGTAIGFGLLSSDEMNIIFGYAY